MTRKSVLDVRCNECRFYKGWKESGNCMRHPPAFINNQWTVPPVRGDWSCGEHESEEAAGGSSSSDDVDSSREGTTAATTTRGTIPEMTDPLSAGWDQPSSRDWIVEPTQVTLPRSDFLKLRSYETSFPTGVYAGKMWRNSKYVCWYEGNPGDELFRVVAKEAVLVD